MHEQVYVLDCCLVSLHKVPVGQVTVMRHTKFVTKHAGDGEDGDGLKVLTSDAVNSHSGRLFSILYYTVSKNLL